MVFVSCSMPTGIRLVAGDDEVVLKPGPNEVDDAFWAEWLKDHSDFPPLLDGAILVHTPETPEQIAEREAAAEADRIAQEAAQKALEDDAAKAAAEQAAKDAAEAAKGSAQ